MMESLPTTVIPIAQLSPDRVSAPASLRGVVTVIWPYSASKQSISLLFVEHDFRLRKHRGQVRITFRGHAATAVALARISSGDALVLSLEGVTFEKDDSKERTPGRGIEWQLKYSRQLHVRIERGEGEPTALNINRATPTPEPESSVPETSEGGVESPPLRAQPVDKDDQVWSSPAFLSHRAAYDHPFGTPFSIEDEDESFEDNNRSKRTKFGRQSGQWRFAERDLRAGKDPSGSEGASLNSIEAVTGDFTSSLHGKQSKPMGVVAAADSSLSSENFAGTTLPEAGADELQLTNEMLSEAVAEFGQIPISPTDSTKMKQSGPFVPTQNVDDFADLGLPENLLTGLPNLDTQYLPSIPVPTAGLLSSPDFQGFPAEISPLFGVTHAAPDHPLYEPVESAAAEIEQPRMPERAAEPEFLSNVQVEQEPVLPQDDSHDQPAHAARSSTTDLKDGTATKPIEIIDLESDSSSGEASPTTTSKAMRKGYRPEVESDSADNEKAALSAASDDQSEEGDEREDSISISGSSSHEQDDEVSDTEEIRPRQEHARNLRSSHSADATSVSESEGEADAEGEVYDVDDEVNKARSSSASRSSAESETVVHERLSRTQYQRSEESVESAEEIESHDTASSRNTPEVDEIKATESSTAHQVGEDPQESSFHRGETAEGQGEDSGETGNQNKRIISEAENQLVTSSTTQPDDSAEKPPKTKLMSKTQLVARERAENQSAGSPGEDQLDAGSKLAIMTSEHVSQNGAMDLDQPKKYRISTELTTAASNIARGLVEAFELDQNKSFGGFRTPLAYFATIETLSQYFNGKVDVLAVVVGRSEIQRAKKGPRDYFITLALADPWTNEIGSPGYTSAQIIRRSKTALPQCDIGNAIVLRQFKVQQREGKLQLLSCDSSAWAVFTKSQGDEFITSGPPLELGAEETRLANGLQHWWAALEHKMLTREEDAVPTKPRKKSLKDEVLDSTPPASPERHVLRDGTSYADGPGEAVHKLRDGATYSD